MKWSSPTSASNWFIVELFVCNWSCRGRSCRFKNPLLGTERRLGPDVWVLNNIINLSTLVTSLNLEINIVQLANAELHNHHACKSEIRVCTESAALDRVTIQIALNPSPSQKFESESEVALNLQLGTERQLTHRIYLDRVADRKGTTFVNNRKAHPIGT